MTLKQEAEQVFLMDGGLFVIARPRSSERRECATYGPADVAVWGEADFRSRRLGREQEAHDGQGNGVDNGQHYD